MSFFLTPRTNRRNVGFNNGLVDALDRLVESTFADASGGFLVQPALSSNGPQSFVTTTDEAHRIDIALPGVPKDAVNVSVSNGTLTVGYESEGTDANSSAFSTSFTKTWTLPDGVDVDGITAASENGVLSVTIPYANVSGLAGRTITVE